jgi:RNA-directed DNA polymerase
MGGCSGVVGAGRWSGRNAGRKTAGIDGEIALSPRAKMNLAERVQRRSASWRALPVKRVYIPKKQGSAKLRPLGIPVIVDRVHQRRCDQPRAVEHRAARDGKAAGVRYYKTGVEAGKRYATPRC